MSRLRVLSAGALVSAITLIASAQEPEPSGNPDDEALEETGGSAGQSAGSADTESAEPRPHVEEPDEPGPEPPIVPPATDTLSGHLSLSPSIALAKPFGYLETDGLASQAIGNGYGFGLDLGYGVSRYVQLGLWGELQQLGAGQTCTSCKAQSMGFGAFVQYHLVQGVRFDPWISAGLGYRSTKIKDPLGDVTYAGPQLFRVVLGGDWYAFDKVGFGPFLELGMDRTVSRSPGPLSGDANQWMLLVGARITLDLPGK